jgi:hypothetical protein
MFWHRVLAILSLLILIWPTSLIAQTKRIEWCYEIVYTSGYGQTPEEACAGEVFTSIKYLNSLCRENTVGRCASRGAQLWTGRFNSLTSESPRLEVRDWFGDPEFVCHIPIVCEYRLLSPDVTNPLPTRTD